MLEDREVKLRLCDNLEGWDAVGDGRRFKRVGTYVYLWLIHVHVSQKATQYCKAIILQLKIFCCSVTKSLPSLCDPMDCSTSCSPVLQYLPEFSQTHINWVDDVIQPFCPLSPLSPLVFHLVQHHSIFQWVGSSHQVAKVLELQHEPFQWIFRVDFL